MNKALLTAMVFIGVCVSHVSANAASEVCPAINCDCDSLSKPQWVSVCQQHEVRIKEECVKNSNTAKDYCLVHGLNAKPLPLALEPMQFDASYVPPVDPNASKRIKELLWGLVSDIEQVQLAKTKAEYGKVNKLLNLIDSNIDSVFEQQQIFAQTKSEVNVFNSSRSSWKNYSKGIVGAAEKLEVLANDLTTSLANAKSKKETKIFTVLAKKSYRMSGKSFEQAGYAYGKAGMSAEAAEAWQDASKQSVNTASINKSAGGDQGAIKYSEFQTAARLHRASFHWLSSENVIDSERVIFESQQYLSHEDQKNLGSLLERLERENLQDGELSER